MTSATRKNEEETISKWAKRLIKLLNGILSHGIFSQLFFFLLLKWQLQLCVRNDIDMWQRMKRPIRNWNITEKAKMNRIRIGSDSLSSHRTFVALNSNDTFFRAFWCRIFWTTGESEFLPISSYSDVQNVEHTNVSARCRQYSPVVHEKGAAVPLLCIIALYLAIA